MTIENRSPEPIETVSEDYRHELDAKTEIAKLVYMWRFCGVPDEYETEWSKEGECIRQSCRALAERILEVIKKEGT